jgi:hypothetical protein
MYTEYYGRCLKMIKTFRTALGTFAAVCLVSSPLAGCSQTARAPGQYGGTGVGYGTTNYAGTTAPGRNMAGTGYGSNVGYNTGYGYNGYNNGYLGMNRPGYNGTNTSLGNQLGIGNYTGSGTTGYGTTGYGMTGNRTGYGTTGYGTTGNVNNGYGMMGNRTGYGTTPYGTNAGFGYTGYGTTGHGTNTNMGYTGGTNVGANFGTTGMNGTGMNTNTGTSPRTVGTGVDTLRSSALRRHVLATKGVNAAEVIVVGDTALVGIKTNGTVSTSRCKAAVSRKVKATDTSIRKVKVSDATDILYRMRRLSTNLTGTTSNNFNTEFNNLVGTTGRR